MSGADNEVCPDCLAVDRHHADRVGAVIEEWDVILVSNLPDLSDLVLVCELIVEVVDHHEHGKFSGLGFDLFDLLCGSFTGNDIFVVQRYFPDNPAGVFDCEELGIVGEC